jgi:hypothetical protein
VVYGADSAGGWLASRSELKPAREPRANFPALVRMVLILANLDSPYGNMLMLGFRAMRYSIYAHITSNNPE